VWVSRSVFYCGRGTRTGYLLHSALVPFVSEDGESQLVELWSYIWGVVMKRPPKNSAARPVDHASSAEVKKGWPSLHEWLTCARWEDDGADRQSPTLTVWAQSGQWKLCLRDRDQSRVLWLGAASLVELVDLADGIVLSPDAPWRHDDDAHERNGKRIKKSS
jgi:hypothetical protein